MNYQSVMQTLDTALEQKVVSSFEELITEYDNFYKRFVTVIRSLQEKGEDEIIEAEFDRLFKDISAFLEMQQIHTFTRSYVDGIKQALAHVVAPGERPNNTPLRKEIQSVLAESETSAHLLREFKQQQLPFFMRLEQELAPYIQTDNSDEHLSIDYSSLLDLLQKQRDYLEGPFWKELEKHIASIHSSIAARHEERATARRKIRERQAEKRWSQMILKLKRIEKQWHQPQKLLVERSKNILSFLKLEKDLRAYRVGFLNNMAEQFQKEFYLPMQEFRQRLIEAVFDIRKGGGRRSPESINAVKEQLLKYINHHLEVPFRKMKEDRIISQQVEQFSEQLLMRITQAPEKMSFIFNLPREGQPSAEDFKQIEWRLLLLRIYREQIINNIKPSRQEYDLFIANIIDVITEIKDVLDINLEPWLLNQEQNREEGPTQVAVQALERIIKRLGHLTLILQNEFDSLEKIVKEAEGQFFDSAVTCFNAKSASELQKFITQYRIKETTRDWQNIAHRKARKTKSRLSLWYRFVRKKMHGYIKEIKRFWGYSDVSAQEAQRADIISYLSETDQKIKELPYIYRRLFDFSHPVDQRFYVPVAEAASTFKKAYEQWQVSSAALAVVGEKGSGKSTFLQLMAEELTGNEPINELSVERTIWTEEDLVNLFAEKLGMDEKRSIDEIVKGLKNSKGRRIVILESIQNAFVRNINGYEAIEKLCYLMAETRNDIFWIVSCSRYGWHFLDKAFKLSESFSHIIRTDTLDAGDLEKMIMSRHRSSGYVLQFEKSTDAQKGWSSKGMTEEEEQQRLRKDYFKKLTEFADGNASIALIFWIRSIRTFDEACIYIKPLEITSVEMIADLSSEVLFVLAAFVIHDTVSDEDLSMILNLSLTESRMMLIRLSSKGLLVEKNNDYMLNQLVYRQIVRVLKERNILHLVE